MLMARRSCLITELRQEFEIFHVGEDAVVRHERNLEPDRGGGHPAIRLMLLLAQTVPGPDTPCPERRICLDEVWPRPHDLCPCNLVIQPSEPPRPPPSQPGAVTKLGEMGIATGPKGA